MSRYHQNVTWQSKDGTWSRGFFERIPCGGGDCDDETHEWCDDFDESAFEWVSTGHPNEDAADRSWTGGNPGGTDGGGAYNADNPTSVTWAEEYDDLAAVLYEQERDRLAGRPDLRPGWGTYGAYEGPPRQRTIDAMQAQREQMVRDWIGHRLGGYANTIDPREQALNEALTERRKTATPEELAAYEARSAQHRDTMRRMLIDHRARRAERARQRRPYGSHYYDPGFAQRERDLTAREAQVEAFIAQCDEAAAQRAAKAAPTPAKTEATKPSSTGQSRQPKGVPAGGQFAASARAESTVSLSAPSPTTSTATDFASWGDDPWA